MAQQRKKIHWTSVERTLVFNWAFEHRDELKGPKLFHSAQTAVLGIERHRPINELLTQEMRNYIKSRVDQLPPLKTLEEVLDSLPQRKESVVVPVAVKEETTSIKIDTLSDTLAHLALHILSVPTIRTHISQIILDTIPQLPVVIKEDDTSGTPFPTREHTLEREQLPRVLIAGLKGHQMNEINKDFKSCLSLKFWDSSKSLHALRRISGNADIVVVFASFISHDATQVIVTRNKNVHNHHGGIAGLRAYLESYIIKGDHNGK